MNNVVFCIGFLLHQKTLQPPKAVNCHDMTLVEDQNEVYLQQMD